MVTPYYSYVYEKLALIHKLHLLLESYQINLIAGGLQLVIKVTAEMYKAYGAITLSDLIF